MPEGDTVHYAAARIRAALAGRELERVLTPAPRTASLGWQKQLLGRQVGEVRAQGKNLFIEIDEGLIIHSHLRMSGSWVLRRQGERWPRPRHRAWLVLGHGPLDAIQFDGSYLELRQAREVASDLRLRALGPDICLPNFDLQAALSRLHELPATLSIGEALLNQRFVAGIGNVWKSEGCFAAGVSPFRQLATLTDAEALAILQPVHEQIQVSAREGTQLRPKKVYGQAGRRCSRCGAQIKRGRLGEDNRVTYWCAGCQV